MTTCCFLQERRTRENNTVEIDVLMYVCVCVKKKRKKMCVIGGDENNEENKSVCFFSFLSSIIRSWAIFPHVPNSIHLVIHQENQSQRTITIIVFIMIISPFEERILHHPFQLMQKLLIFTLYVVQSRRKRSMTMIFPNN